MKNLTAVAKKVPSQSVKKQVVVKRSSEKTSPTPGKGQPSREKVRIRASGIGGRSFEQVVDGRTHFATLKDALGKRWRIPPSSLKLINDCTVIGDADRVDKYCCTANGCLDLAVVLTTETLCQQLSDKATDSKKLQGLADLRKLGRHVGEPGIEAVCACLCDNRQAVRMKALSTLKNIVERNSQFAIDKVAAVCSRDESLLPIAFRGKEDQFASWMMKVLRAIADKENTHVIDALVQGIGQYATETLLNIFCGMASCQQLRRHLVEQLVKRGLVEGSNGALHVGRELQYMTSRDVSRSWGADIVETIIPYLGHEDESTHKRALKALSSSCRNGLKFFEDDDLTQIAQKHRDLYARAVAAISDYGSRQGLTTERMALRALKRFAMRSNVLSDCIKEKRAWLEGAQDVQVKADALRALGVSARRGDQAAVAMATAFINDVDKRVRSAALDALIGLVDYNDHDMQQHFVRRCEDYYSEDYISDDY